MHAGTSVDGMRMAIGNLVIFSVFPYVTFRGYNV